MKFIRSLKSQLKARRRITGLNDLLSYLMLLDDTTVLHKDGALSQHFCYEPPDLDSSTQTDLTTHAHTWQQALAFLGDGWMIETNVISLPFEFKKSPHIFPEIVSAIIDDEKTLQLQSGKYFRSKYMLSITFKPSSLNHTKFKRFIFNEEHVQCPLDKEVMQFKQKVKEFTDYLSRSNKLTRLHTDDIMTLFHQCLTGSTHGLVAPYSGAFLDTYLSSEDFIGGFSPQIGKQSIHTLAIDDLPTYSYPCILDLLTNFPINYRWSSRFIPLDSNTAQTYLKRFERNWSSKAIGLLGVLRETLGMPAKLNQDAENMANEIHSLIFE